MIKYNEVKLTYTCAAAPPPGLYMDRIYTIGKDKKGFYFTDGNYMEHVKDSDIWYIQMLFSPQNCDWVDVDFSEEKEKEKETIKETMKTFDKIIPQK